MTDNASFRDTPEKQTEISEQSIHVSTCIDCSEPIRLVFGYWVDNTYTDNGIASPEFASLCETGGIHQPINS